MESFWKIKEVAAAVQVSVGTVYRYVERGEMPFHRLNTVLRFKPSEIETWMDGRSSRAKADKKKGREKKLNDGLFEEAKETGGGEA
jgi:excisionase family DNA binding protein